MEGQQLVDNVSRRVEFELEGMVLARRLVETTARDMEELSVSSPVGSALRHLAVGQVTEVKTPAGRVVVTVLGVRD